MDYSPKTFGLIFTLNLRGKNLKNSQIYPGTKDENKNYKVRTIKILLDSGASASTIRKDIFHIRHRILT